MKRIIYYMYITCFFAALILPLMLYPWVEKRLDHNNYENRELITIEAVKESNWKMFFPNLEKYFDDYMPYKNESIAVLNWVDEHLFGDLFSESVMVGKENWLFYKGDECIGDYRGGYQLSNEELEKYAKSAKVFEETLQQLGIELYIMITPNKEAIYGARYLPDKVKRVSQWSRADAIVEYLVTNTELNVVYPKQELQRVSDEYQVWRKYDTHWNTIGAFVASQTLLESCGVKSASLEDVIIGEEGYCSGDLAGMLGRMSEYSDDIIYTVNNYDTQVNYESTEYVLQPNLAYERFESDAVNGSKVLFIGDSFLGSMEQFLAPAFRTTVFVHRDNYEALEKDLIFEEKPDIIVFQSAERFLTYYDDYMVKYAQICSEK